MIHLLVLRHGEASFDAPSDDERMLTPRGEASVRSVCSVAKEQISNINHILVSPLVRAQQTAAIVCEEVSRLVDASGASRDKTPRVTWPLLKPESNVTSLLDALLNYTLQKNNSEQESQTLLLVTHQPLVSRFLEDLCELSNNSKSAFFSDTSSKYAMGTASLAYVTLDVMASSCGTLEWIHHPQ